jgi:hypothetical protein
MLVIQPDGVTPASVKCPTTAGTITYVRLLRGATTIAEWACASSPTGASDGGTINTPVSMVMVDAPAANTYTYKVQAYTSSGSGSVLQYVLAAYEL